VERYSDIRQYEQRRQTVPILFIGKANDPYTDDAAETVRQLFEDATIVRIARGDKIPEAATSWTGDWLISFLCPAILTNSLLDRATVGAINFHPGPPSYPGVGCTNFALYNREKRYGVTCHFMASKVDTGPIIEVRHLPVYENDSVLTLTKRCYAYQIQLFHEILHRILTGVELMPNGLKWERTPYTSHDFNELNTISPDMTEEEIARRTRATVFPGFPGPELVLFGKRYVLQQLNTPIPVNKK